MSGDAIIDAFCAKLGDTKAHAKWELTGGIWQRVPDPTEPAQMCQYQESEAETSGKQIMMPTSKAETWEAKIALQHSEAETLEEKIKLQNSGAESLEGMSETIAPQTSGAETLEGTAEKIMPPNSAATISKDMAGKIMPRNSEAETLKKKPNQELRGSYKVPGGGSAGTEGDSELPPVPSLPIPNPDEEHQAKIQNIISQIEAYSKGGPYPCIHSWASSFRLSPTVEASLHDGDYEELPCIRFLAAWMGLPGSEPIAGRSQGAECYGNSHYFDCCSIFFQV